MNLEARTWLLIVDVQANPALEYMILFSRFLVLFLSGIVYSFRFQFGFFGEILIRFVWGLDSVFLGVFHW